MNQQIIINKPMNQQSNESKKLQYLPYHPGRGYTLHELSVNKTHSFINCMITPEGFPKCVYSRDGNEEDSLSQSLIVVVSRQTMCRVMVQ